MSGWGAAAPGIDPERVAELLVTPGRPGPERRGSGYRVSGSAVLTAAHVVRDAGRVRVRFNADRPGEWLADGEVEWSDETVDAAVVVITPPPGEAATVEPVGFGRVAERDAVVTASAMGFPRFKLREDPGGGPGPGGGPTVYRDAAHAVGTIAVLANRREGTLELTVTPPGRDPDPDRSPWEGMSGAAVWCGGRVIGLVAEHHRGDGLGRLAATRVDGWYERLDGERLDRLRDLLALPGRPAELGDVVPVPTAGLLAASYTAQIRDIAPERLLGRERELAELVEFCAGEERYRWLRADPWAGKSALAAWFALHPPAGVTVVSFFVTRRLVGQTDSIAFTEAMVEQLAMVAGEQVAGSATAAGRDKERRRLFDQAVRRVGERGQRLLLLVDGLDEDEGARPGSGRPSIASLLPERPPENVRVLVTSRPHPGIPNDVPGGHPLRHCVPRTLAASPAAHDIEVAAKDELSEQLHGDPVQVDILGLLTATGGGLTAGELSALSGQPTWALAARLGSAFGRSLKTRTPYEQPLAALAERVYLFAHETLRETAEHELASDLGPYRRRVDDWADDHRDRGWPEDTPQYLLRPYGVHLGTRKQLARLVELATDLRRQERMLLATSGDGAAIAELTAAQKLALDDPAPDLEVLGRLAVHKDRLAGRNQTIPVALPALWVRLGQPERGEALARSLASSGFRDEALAAVAGALADAGLPDWAEEVARGIPDPKVRAPALVTLAKAHADADPDRTPALLDEAEQTARAIPDDHVQPLVLGEVAAAQAEAGQWERAERTASSITGLYAAAGARALRLVTGALAARGQWERAERTAGRIHDSMVRAEALARLGTAMIGVDRERAKALLDRAEGAARGSALLSDDAGSLRVVVAAVTQLDRDRGLALAAGLEQSARRFPAIGQPGALRAVAGALAAIGRWDDAVRVAGSIPTPSYQADAFRDIAEALAGAGRWDEAERTAREIAVPRVRAEALVSVAEALAGPDRRRARALAADAEQTARAIAWGNAQAWVRRDVAAAQAAAGQLDRAERTARGISDPWVRSRALLELVEALAGTRQWDRAEQTARGVADAGVRAEALGRLAMAMTGVARERALVLAAEAEQLADGLPDLEDRAQGWALMFVTAALARAGAWDNAERTAAAIPRHNDQVKALVSVAEALARAGRLHQARQVADGISDRSARLTAVGAVAAALAGVDRDRATALAEEVEEAAEAADDYQRDEALRAAARARVALGHWDDAERHLRGVDDIEARAEGLSGLVEALAGAGQLDRAEHTARTVGEPSLRVRALAAVLAARYGTDPDRARTLAAEAERTARTIAGLHQQAEAFGTLVAAVAAAPGFAAAGRDDPLHGQLRRLLAEMLAGTAWQAAIGPLARVQPSALEAVDQALRAAAS